MKIGEAKFFGETVQVEVLHCDRHNEDMYPFTMVHRHNLYACPERHCHLFYSRPITKEQAIVYIKYLSKKLPNKLSIRTNSDGKRY